MTFTRPAQFLLIALLLTGGQTLASSEDIRVSFVASYRGLLTAGAQLAIAKLDLRMGPAPDGVEFNQVTLSTQAYDAAEFFLPVRFCYRNRLQPDTGATLQANWWSRIGTEASKGELRFDRQKQQVIRRHVKSKLSQTQAMEDEWARQSGPGKADIKQDQDIQSFPDQSLPMDQLGMIRRLSLRTFEPGQELLLPVRDGRDLEGYRVVAEAYESLDWHDRQVASIRLRLEPLLSKKDEEKQPTLVWLERGSGLPLRLRSSRTFGHFELLRLPRTSSPALDCHIPEAIALPDFQQPSDAGI